MQKRQFSYQAKLVKLTYYVLPRQKVNMTRQR